MNIEDKQIQELTLDERIVFNQEKKSKGAVWGLWLLLAGFGAHRFYMGKIGSGFVYVALNTIGWVLFPFNFIAIVVWWIIDAFLINEWLDTHNNLLIKRIKKQ